MAQSGFTPIKLYLSTTAAATPTAANLEPGELALNNNDGKLFYEDSAGVVQVIATKAGASGDVVGPASATANAIPSFDGTTGKLIKDNSGATVSAGVITATGFSGPLNGTVGATTPSTVVATQVDITAQGDLRLQDTTGGEYVALQAPSTIATSYTLTLPVDDGTAGQALITDGSGVLSWSTAASGDVYGPASATDNAVARYDGTTGKIIQNSAVTIGDDGATVIAANSSSDGLRITQTGAGNALLVEDSANPDSSPFAILSNGQVIQGATQSYTTTVAGTNYNPTIQMHAANANTPAIGYEVANWATTTGAGSFSFAKSRGGVIGTHTVVNSNDSVGETYYFGSDGTNFIEAARIGAAVDGTPGTNDMPGRLVFSTTADGASSPTERMRINAAGEVGIGGSSLTGYTLRLNKAVTGSTFAGSQIVDATIQSGVTGGGYSYISRSTTAAAAFTLSNLYHFYSNPQTFGAGSAVTSQYGFHAESSLTGATNNYGFYGNIASGTGRWNFYAAGTASNFFEGSVGVGTTTMSQVFNVTGVNSTGFAGQRIQNNNANVGIAGIEFSSDGAYAKAAIGLLRQNANGAGALIFYNDSNADAANWVVGDEKMRISQTGVISLGAAPGAESLRVTPVASAVNYWSFAGRAAGSAPYVQAEGSDTNIDLLYAAKGTGAHVFYTAGFSFTPQFRIAHTASAVNYLQVTGGATGSPPYLLATGSDTDVSASYYTKGVGAHYFRTNQNPTQFVVAHTASAVNYLQVTGGATGVGVALSAQGSDANIINFYSTKGTGAHSFFTGGGNQFTIANTASAVNAVVVYGSATGTAVQIAAAGSDTNIDITLTPKGNGYVVVDSAYSPNLTLTDAATITWDTGTAGGQVATFTFVSTNRTMGAPTNLKNGGFYALAVIQNAGSNTLTFNSVFKWAGGVAPTLSTAAGARDYFVFRSDGTNLYQQGISQAVA